MQPSPLQLRGYFLKSLRFSLNNDLEVMPRGSLSFDELTLNVTANTTPETDDPLSWRSELLIESVDDANLNLPYSFGLVLVGFFVVSESYPTEGVKLLAKTNSPAVLYSAAREILATVTRRGPYVPTLLPSITFLEVPKEEKKQKKGAPSTNGSGKSSAAKKRRKRSKRQ